jgi:hypothetical protein
MGGVCSMQEFLYYHQTYEYMGGILLKLFFKKQQRTIWGQFASALNRNGRQPIKWNILKS